MNITKGMDLYWVYDLYLDARGGWVVMAESHDAAKTAVIDAFGGSDVFEKQPDFCTRKFKGPVVSVTASIALEKPNPLLGRED